MKTLLTLLVLVGIGALIVKFLSTQPDLFSQIQDPLSKTVWVQVDIFAPSLTCTDFCKAINKQCAASSCRPDTWCKYSGGLAKTDVIEGQKQCISSTENECHTTFNSMTPGPEFYCCCN